MPAATVNGVNLSYQTAGPPGGRPLVLLHGFSGSAQSWDPIWEALAARSRVFAYDQRGHGGSDKPEGPYRIQDFADDLLAFLNYMGLDRVDLMGHSMGGRTALLFALQHGGRLNRLLLVGASGAAPQGEALARFDTLKKTASGQGMEAVFELDLMGALLPPAFQKGGAGRAAFRGRFLKNTPEAYCAAMDAILAMPDLTGRLGEIQTPAWVCVGGNDAGPRAFSDLCVQRLPRCARSIIPGCGHYPMTEDTPAFLSAMDAFLGATPAAREEAAP